jgi:hypothetical protein
MVSPPARVMSELTLTFPVLSTLPIVRLLPEVVELIGLLTVTVKELVIPTTLRLPDDKADVITELAIFAVPVTVKVFPLRLQLSVVPVEDIVNVCAETIIDKDNPKKTNKKRKIICIFFASQN